MNKSSQTIYIILGISKEIPSIVPYLPLKTTHNDNTRGNPTAHRDGPTTKTRATQVQVNSRDQLTAAYLTLLSWCRGSELRHSRDLLTWRCTEGRSRAMGYITPVEVRDLYVDHTR